MQVLALLSYALAIHPVVAVSEVHRLVPNGPITGPRSRGRSRVPRALVMLEPAFPTMLALSSHTPSRTDEQAQQVTVFSAT